MGNRIINYIQNNNITMEQLADGIGKSQGELEKLLKSKAIDSLLYYKVCKFLNVPYELFIEGCAI